MANFDKIVSIWDKKLVPELLKGVHLSSKIAGNFKPEDSFEKVHIESVKDDGLIPLLEDLEIATSMTCSVCNIAFQSREEQVQHFKLDWHCENLKRRDEGLPPINKEGTLISDSSHPDSADQNRELSEEDGSLSSSDSEEEENSQNSRTNSIRRAKIYFENELGEMLSVHRCILLYKKEVLHSELEVIERLKRLTNSTKTWAVLLLGGGHFAGGIFKENDVLVHKTFHRYITRAKQGSVQSIHDQHQKHAKSAGAQLRRHNELALIEEIQTLIQTWSELLNGCSHIFYRATGNNKRALFGGRKPLFPKDDHRFRSIPFPTKQASHQEVVRTCTKLSTIECYGNASEWKDKIALPSMMPASPKKTFYRKNKSSSPKERNEQAEEKTNELPDKLNKAQNKGNFDISRETDGNKKTRQGTPHESRSSSRETNDDNLILDVREELFDISDIREFEVFMPELKSVSTSESSCKSASPPFDKEGQRLRNALYTACRVDDSESVQHLLAPLMLEKGEFQNSSRSELLLQILNSTFGNNGVTLLHICAKCGYTALLWLLLEYGADPSVGDRKGQYAYVLAVNKETRNTFRRFMAAFPEKYDYITAQIPSPLSKEAEKEKLIKQQQKRQQKKHKTKALKIEQEEKTKFLNSTDAEKKAHVKTQRAVSRCFFCGNSLENKVPFSYDEFKFCTLRCLQLHRRKQ